MLTDEEPGTTYCCCTDLRGGKVNFSFAGANSQYIVRGGEITPHTTWIAPLPNGNIRRKI